MRKAVRICVAIVALCVLAELASAGKKAPPAPTEETLLGPISCTITAKPVPKAAPAPQAPGAPPAAGPNGAPQTPGTNAPPPAVPQPITNVKDCLSSGGKVVILPDGFTATVEIENPTAMIGHEWNRVSVSGYRVGETFRVVSVRII